MNRDAQSFLKVSGTITMALMAVVPTIAGVWAGLATHEFGHAIGCVTGGRAITACSVVSRVECGAGFSAPDAWRIGLPAYTLPPPFGNDGHLPGTTCGDRVQIRKCAILRLAFRAGDVSNFLASTRVDHVTLAIPLFGIPAVAVVLTRHSLWRNAMSCVAVLDSSSDQIAAHLRDRLTRSRIE
jgi:hypothetical protein